MHKVLVVDDSKTQVALMAHMLHANGYDVVTASDGDEALRVVMDERPDCIVLDVVLPKQNGFQLCRRLKLLEDMEDVRIILIGGAHTETDQAWGLQHGADAYLTKPFHGSELVSAVSCAVNGAGFAERA